MANTEENRFETSQTVVAAYFHYVGLEIVEMIWLHGQCTFYFEKTDDLIVHLAKFVSGEARVEPQGFNNAYGEVKTRMFRTRDAVSEEDK